MPHATARKGSIDSPTGGATRVPSTPAKQGTKPRAELRRKSATGRAVMGAHAGPAKAEELKDFVEWCLSKKWKNAVIVWKKLDKDGNMIIHKGEFMRGLRELQYGGDVERLWQAIDSDHTGIISFSEFCPETALDLARFKQWAVEKFGGMQATFRAFDTDRSGNITLAEFDAAARALEGFPPALVDSIQSLFLLLDKPEGITGVITEDELKFLDAWQPPEYLWAKPDVGAKERFKIALLKKHNMNPLSVWRKVLDKDASMRVNYDEFNITCKTLSRSGISEASPPCGVTALYVAFDSDRSGWFSLRNWDIEAYEALYAFAKIVRKTGKATDYIRTLAQGDGPSQGNGKALTWDAFKAAFKGKDLSNAAMPLVFEALCVGKAGHLCAADVQFLDRWSPDTELQEEIAWGNMVAAHFKG